MNPDSNETKISVSNRTVVRLVVILLGTYLLLRFFIRIDHVLYLIFFSVFLALALNPAVSWLSRKLHISSRIYATGIAYLTVVALLAVFFALVLPPLIRQSINFIDEIPKNITALQNPNSAAGKVVKHYHLTGEISNLSKNISNYTKHIQGPAISTATKIGGDLISFVIVLALTFMMLVEGPVWLERYWKLRIDKKQWHKELAMRMYRIITGYINGQFILAVIGAAFSLVVLLISSSLLHVSINAVALAGIILLTGLIPMIGHSIGLVFVVISCLFVSWPLALIVGIILLIYIQIETITLQPYIQSKYNELSPLLVFIAALVGISAGGILGAFVAIPLAGCLKVAFREFLVHKKIIA